jgi:hypothetical protein
MRDCDYPSCFRPNLDIIALVVAGEAEVADFYFFFISRTLLQHSCIPRRSFPLLYPDVGGS